MRRNLNLLKVQVYPRNTRRRHLQRPGPDDGAFVRVGSTNRKAEALQIEELKRWNRMDSFDEQAVPDLQSEAIDFRAASGFLSVAPRAAAEAFALARKRLTKESVIEGVRREERWSVPLVAIRATVGERSLPHRNHVSGR
jgi:predicted HTH transcriptional regulator